MSGFERMVVNNLLVVEKQKGKEGFPLLGPVVEAEAT
jgi:hypothetical protein